MRAGFAIFGGADIAVDWPVMQKQGAHRVPLKEASPWSML